MPPKITPAQIEARSAGLKRFEGAECKKGHGTTRFVSNGQCVVCSKESARKWIANNRERWSEIWAAWRVNNVEYDRKRCREWQKNNPAKTVANIAKRKAAKLQRTPPWADVREIERFYDLAKTLTQTTGRRYEVDHIVPLLGKDVCGLHVQDNLRVVTQEENRRKGNRLA